MATGNRQSAGTNPVAAETSGLFNIQSMKKFFGKEPFVNKAAVGSTIEAVQKLTISTTDAEGNDIERKLLKVPSCTMSYTKSCLALQDALVNGNGELVYTFLVKAKTPDPDLVAGVQLLPSSGGGPGMGLGPTTFLYRI